MKYLRIILVYHLLFFATSDLLAQRYHSLLKPCSEKLGFRHFITKTPWRVQLAWNLIEDDGKPFRDLFDVQKSWNFPPYPSKLSIEKDCKHNINVELAVAYSNYKSGKVVNGDLLSSNASFLSVDLNGKYIFSKNYRVEPYLLVGLGYTHRGTIRFGNAVNVNAGLGATIWLIDNLLGLNIQGSSKFGLQSGFPSSGSNYLQHSVGVVYKFSGRNIRVRPAKAHLKRIYDLN
ncbi:MAG: hypothetical protein H7141_14775 [Burkholderiales bacterium]|nr:hypothetical protein [Bacteroidia bacterium]